MHCYSKFSVIAYSEMHVGPYHLTLSASDNVFHCTICKGDCTSYHIAVYTMMALPVVIMAIWLLAVAVIMLAASIGKTVSLSVCLFVSSAYSS